MIEIASLPDITRSAATENSGSPSPGKNEIEQFRDLLENQNPVGGSIKSFVESAQDSLVKSSQIIDKKLREFDSRHAVPELVNAMHESAMKSVSIQLTSKIGSKVSESFEQLVKQQ